MQTHPNIDTTTIHEDPTSTAQKLDPKGRDDQYGWGLIDPASALAELESRMTDNQVASISQPPTQAAVTKQIDAPKQQRQGEPSRVQPASAHTDRGRVHIHV